MLASEVVFLLREGCLFSQIHLEIHHAISRCRLAGRRAIFDFDIGPAPEHLNIRKLTQGSTEINEGNSTSSLASKIWLWQQTEEEMQMTERSIAHTSGNIIVALTKDQEGQWNPGLFHEHK